MINIEIIVLLLFLVTCLAMVCYRFKFPFPIILVLAGISISIIPALPTLTLQPNWVFFVFLPPLLFAAAWNTSWRNFKANLPMRHICWQSIFPLLSLP
jgi:CPA1 family monovalent cation:H+ antiporter